MTKPSDLGPPIPGKRHGEPRMRMTIFILAHIAGRRSIRATYAKSSITSSRGTSRWSRSPGAIIIEFPKRK
jgi:hypothetical protein